LQPVADLDACRRRDEIADRQPKDERYLHPARQTGQPVLAMDDFDWHGLDAVLDDLRRLSAALSVRHRPVALVHVSTTSRSMLLSALTRF
jgi:hypothetical protein